MPPLKTAIPPPTRAANSTAAAGAVAQMGSPPRDPRLTGRDDGAGIDGVALTVVQGGAQVEFGRTHAAPPVPASTRNRASAREQLLFTVPTGMPSVAAVSCSDRSQ